MVWWIVAGQSIVDIREDWTADPTIVADFNEPHPIREYEIRVPNGFEIRPDRNALVRWERASTHRDSEPTRIIVAAGPTQNPTEDEVLRQLMPGFRLLNSTNQRIERSTLNGHPALRFSATAKSRRDPANEVEFVMYSVVVNGDWYWLVGRAFGGRGGLEALQVEHSLRTFRPAANENTDDGLR